MSNYTIVAHRELAIMNPISSSALDEAVGQLELTPSARVIDIGCGKGELLRRIAAAYACTVEGIDASESLIAEARSVAPMALLRVADVRMVPLETEAYDLAACVGASHAFLDDPLGSLARLVRPGGLVLFGDGYFRRKPDPEYLAAAGIARDELSSLDATIGRAWEAGLALRETFVASQVDFTRYEMTHARAIGVHARNHPDDPEALAMLERSRAWQAAFEKWGKTTMGFALLLFVKRE